jgi:flagellar basal body rod protein FlgF
MTRVKFIICISVLFIGSTLTSLTAFSKYNETQDTTIKLIMTGADSHYQHSYNQIQYILNTDTPGYVRQSQINIQTPDKTVVNEHYYNWRPGPLDYTGRSLDLGIKSNGTAFFCIQLPYGLGFTRDGRFRINYKGTLVTLTGSHPLMGENGVITLPNDNVSVNSAGTIFDENGNRLDQIKIVVFKSTNDMNQLNTPNGVIFIADRVIDFVEDPQFYRVQQGWIETSNSHRSYDTKFYQNAYESTIKTGQVIINTYRTASSLMTP